MEYGPLQDIIFPSPGATAPITGCLMLFAEVRKNMGVTDGLRVVVEFQRSIGYITGKVDKTGGNKSLDFRARQKNLNLEVTGLDGST